MLRLYSSSPNNAKPNVGRRLLSSQLVRRLSKYKMAKIIIVQPKQPNLKEFELSCTKFCVSTFCLTIFFLIGAVFFFTVGFVGLIVFCATGLDLTFFLQQEH